jgi:7-cyano-7-deazaguanine synthase
MRKALVILSGGQDSTTCLFWAKTAFDEVHAITFNYGQRHAVEIEAAKTVARMAGLYSHELVDLSGGVGTRQTAATGPDGDRVLDETTGRKILVGTSGLVSDSPIGHYDSAGNLPGGVEPTFVPGRNLLFLVIAANRAAEIGAKALVTGVCQADYGGYPDCRQAFVDEMAKALSEGVYGDKRSVNIHTPLMNLTKAESVGLAMNTPGCAAALAYSHTCYDGQYPPNPFNHASLLRAKGFAEAGYADPLILRAIAEGKLPMDYPVTGLVEGTLYGDQASWAELISTDGIPVMPLDQVNFVQQIVGGTALVPAAPVVDEPAPGEKRQKKDKKK